MLEKAVRSKLLAIAGKKETPFFVLDTGKLLENQKEFENQAKKHFKKLELCYSLKTNSLPEVLKNIKFGFEIASMHEMQLAGRAKKFSVYNSPCKKPAEITLAIKQGYVIIADSFRELEKIALEAKKTNKKNLGIGLRLNFHSKKFGFSLHQIPKAVKKCKELGQDPVMLHSHIGTKQGIQNYLAFLQHFEKALAFHEFEYINFGSGFPSYGEMKRQGNSLEDYFGLVKKVFGEKLGGKTVVFEPGRVLVEDAMCLVARVHYLKELHGNRIAVLDAGINVLPKIALSWFGFEALSEIKKREREHTTLVGPLLFGNDVLGSTLFQPKEGDFFAITNTGAYCYPLAWEIIYPKPKVVVL